MPCDIVLNVWPATSALNPASSRTLVASSTDMPLTFGTLTKSPSRTLLLGSLKSRGARLRMLEAPSIIAFQIGAEIVPPKTSG